MTQETVKERIYRELIQVIQPIMIPKSIADELDRVFSDIDVTEIGYVLDETDPYSRVFNDYYYENKKIIALYLVSRALGVDVVKVVGRD